ncbi:MAG: DUF6359 domain-containing protein [Bacteroidaceae bacterium]|nr:DUF6359 domain-containing protein [Bacteroidaceae bacterium]
MKKIKFLVFGLLSLMFAACADVPEPYDNPSQGDLPYLSGNLNKGWTTFISTEIGSGENPWDQGSSYVQATGYQDWDGTGSKSKKEVAGYLISPALKTNSLSGDVVICFDYTIRYFDRVSGWENYHKIFISNDYDGKDFESATWEEIPWTPVGSSYSDWTLYSSGNIAVPADYVNKENVYVALSFYAPELSSTTWELQNFEMKEGSAPVPPPPTPIDPKGSGTADDPYNIAKLLQLFAEENIPTEKIYFKGIVANIKELDTGSYGNATYYVSDTGADTNTFYVYRSYYLNNAKFTSTDQLQVGDTVIVYGNVTLYNSTPETKERESCLYWISRGSAPVPPHPSEEGSGTYDDPYTIAGAQAHQSEKGYVKGYIVGFISGQKLTDAVFGTDGAVASNIIIATSADETDISKCLPIQLVGGSAVRIGINLMDNPGMYKKELLIYGSLEKYFGTAGLKSTTYAECDGKTFGTKPGDDPKPVGEGYFMDFKTTGSQGDWTIEDKTLPEGLTYVWNFDSRYGMKASAYISKCFASESWLISPAINLPSGVSTLTIHEAMNQLKGGNRADHVNVMVSTDKTNWSVVNMTGWPAGTDWNFGDYTADFSTYAGKTIYIAFKYTSTDSCAPTWEVEKLSIE